MKALKFIFRWFIWGVVILNIALMVLPQIPSVQFWLGSRATAIIGDALSTDVSVGRIAIGFPNRITIDDFNINDQAGEQLLRAGRLSARVDLFSLPRKSLVINSLQLFGAHANLYRTDSLASPNFQFVLDALSSNDTTSQSTLDLSINSLIVRSSSVKYDDRSASRKDNSFNAKHLAFSNISAHVILKKLTSDSININIKRLAFIERSGLNMKRMTLNANAGRNEANIPSFSIELPHTKFTADSVHAAYDFDHIRETLSFRGNINIPRIEPRDLAFVLPSLSPLRTPLSISLRANGANGRVYFHDVNIDSPEDYLKLNADGSLASSSPYPVWDADISNLMVSPLLMTDVSHLLPSFPEELLRIGRINLTGAFSGNGEGTELIACKIKTESGDADVNGSVKLPSEALDLKINGDKINLRNLLDTPDLGLISANVKLNGRLNDLTAQANVSQLDFKGYKYSDIVVSSNYRNEVVKAALSVNETNALATLNGSFHKDGKRYLVSLNGAVNNLRPQRLNLTDRWGDAMISSRFDADISASSINDAVGSLNISDFLFADSIGSYPIRRIQMNAGFSDDHRYITAKGDMGDIDIRGDFDIATIPQSLVNHLLDKVSELPVKSLQKVPTNNNVHIQAYLSDARWLSRILGVPLTLGKPMMIHANVNDQNGSLSLSGSLPSFSYGDGSYSDGVVNITGDSTALNCRMNIKKRDTDASLFGVGLNMMASNNNVDASISWRNDRTGIEHTSGDLNVNAILQGKGDGSQPRLTVSMQPSNFVMGGATWNVMPSKVIYDEDRLEVEHFAIEHDNQFIRIHGLASAESTDTLTADLRGIDAAYVLDLVNFHSVDFEGFVNGQANIVGLFGELSAWADLKVDEFKFEHGRMGTLYANALWDNVNKQIDINATADDGPEAKTDIRGYVSIGREYIDLDIDGRGTYIEFMNSFASSFLSDCTGHARGLVKLAGPLSSMQLTGQLVIDGKATVTALGTTYWLRNDTVSFVTDDIRLSRIPLYDIYGNEAFMSGGIHHQHLTNLTFDLDVDTDRLLAYDFPDFGENSFYGTVFVDGRCTLRGRPGEVTINVDARPLRGTTFVYNAASNDAISDQNFITWSEARTSTVSPTFNNPFQQSSSASQTQEDANNQSESSTDIFLNFRIDADDASEVKLLMDQRTEDYITLHGDGVLRASFHNKGTFQLFGTYTVNRGTYGITIQNIIKKNFTFQNGGTIIFGGNPFDASLNLQAQYTVNGVSLSDLQIGNSFTSNTIRVNCLMNILGQAGAPRIEFDLDMPTINSEEKQMIRSIISSEQEMNQQVLYLLGIGRFYSQGINNETATQQYDQTSLAMQSFLSGTVSSQFNDVLSQIINSNDWNFGANVSTGNEGWHNAEYEGSVSGRMLNNRLLINGQFGYRDNATKATPSFIGDFDIRYLLFPNGNLALKVYNQTNDRYFTRSSLNTQGIGIIMKKDFSTLGELLLPKWMRKKNE